MGCVMKISALLEAINNARLRDSDFLRTKKVGITVEQVKESL
jgi:hypothetical protein